MAQTTYNYDLIKRTDGQMVRGRLNCEVATKTVDETNGIAAGLFAQATDSTEEVIGLPYSDQAVLSLTAALVSGDVVALSIVVNGVTTALSSTTYATSHAATMAVIEGKIEAVSGIASATVSGNTITVAANAETDIYFSVATVTSGGSGTAVASVTNTTTRTFLGPVVQGELQATGTAGTDAVVYKDQREAGVLEKGLVAVPCLATLAARASLFIKFYGSDRGKLTSAAGSAPTTAIALPAGLCGRLTEAGSTTVPGVFASNQP